MVQVALTVVYGTGGADCSVLLQVEAHITASVALRNLNTIHDLMEGMREGIPGKKPYDALRIGPITRHPVVQQIFGIPSGADVVEVIIV